MKIETGSEITGVPVLKKTADLQGDCPENSGFRLIALDIDGTLLDNSKNLSRYTIAVLNELHKKGLQIILVTGRRYMFAKPVAEQLEFYPVILSNNGNIIRESLHDEKILENFIEPGTFYDIIRTARKYNLTPIVHADHFEECCDFLIEREKEDPCYRSYFSPQLTRYRRVEDMLAYKFPRAMVLCYMEEDRILLELEKDLHRVLPGRISTHMVTSEKRYGSFLEVMDPNGTKWESLKKFAALQGIDTSRILAIGDDNNDAEMLEKAGLGVSMKNGSEKARQSAKCITAFSNEEDGAARFLSDFFGL